MDEKGQSLLEAAIALPTVILAVFALCNIVYAARSAMLLEYSSFVISRAAAVREEDKRTDGVQAAQVFLAASLKDLGYLLPFSRGPLQVEITNESRRIKTTLSYFQRRKYLTSFIGGIWDRVQYLRNLFYSLETTAVVPLERRFRR